MNIINKRIEDIFPYENNPRNNEDAVEYVANSIKKFGWKQPMVIDKEGVIVAGHTRYKAAIKLGLSEVPCVIASDLTDEQIKAYRLADNKVAEASGWDFELLESELAEITEFDMSDFNFNLEANVSLDQLDEFFLDPEEKTKEPKTIKCPHCGELIEV